MKTLLIALFTVALAGCQSLTPAQKQALEQDAQTAGAAAINALVQPKPQP